MQRYKAIVEYDGSNYYGMQKQKDTKNTIQETIEDAISKFANIKIEIEYSGRTDSGVHAFGQVIHFDLQKELDEYKVLNGINFYLINQNIVVKDVKKVSSYFHARFSAKYRKYMYRVLNSKTYSPILKNRVYYYPYSVNIKKMQKIANKLCGIKMDFSSFCKAESVDHVNTIKTINKIEIKKNGDEINFYFEAKSFLHNMIRIMVGVFLEIGREKITEEDLKNILKSKKRPNNCQTVPSYGLYFMETIY